MSWEIEHKFLLTGDDWRKLATLCYNISQGYIPTSNGTTVRVRIADQSAFVTLKKFAAESVRQEFNYEIPLKDAETLLKGFCNHPLIEKKRYIVPFGGYTWEIDEFLGDNSGLIFAEIELPDCNASFEIPPWAGKDVTHLRRYYNANLYKHPFSAWTDWEKNGLDCCPDSAE